MNRKISYKLRTGQAKLVVREIHSTKIYKKYDSEVCYNIGDNVIVGDCRSVVEIDYKFGGDCVNCALDRSGNCSRYCTRELREDKTSIIFKKV